MHRTSATLPILSLLAVVGLVGCSSKSSSNSAPAASCSMVSASCECSSIDTCDAGTCNSGGGVCITSATPDKVIGDLTETGQEYVQLPAPYGQQNCQGHGVIEISDRSLGTSTGLYVNSTWDQGQTTTACEDRRSQFEVWVQLDDGLSDAGQGTWIPYDRVTVRGVVPASLPQGCLAQVQCREKTLPASLGSMCDSPISHVALNRNADKDRVTSVRVVARASAHCDALPLEFLVSPRTE